CPTWYCSLIPFSAPKTRVSKRIGPHNIDILSIIFGSMLGDSWGGRSSASTYFVLQQEDSNVGYLMWFHKYAPGRPKMEKRVGKGGRIRFYYRVRTLCFSSFNWIHLLFYPNGVKVVPANIAEYLTPLALAIWIMDDGLRISSGLSIATHGFSKADVEILSKVLWVKYGLKTTLHRFKPDLDQYTLYISARSMPLLVTTIRPHLHPSMYYK
ncbi:hypothetical protein DFJ77DRAFT_436209, partial [Powellomyces hirtus]